MRESVILHHPSEREDGMSNFNSEEMKKILFTFAFVGVVSFALPLTANANVHQMDEITVTYDSESKCTIITYTDENGCEHVTVRDSKGRTIYQN